jgi:hypothetical protein
MVRCADKEVARGLTRQQLKIIRGREAFEGTLRGLFSWVSGGLVRRNIVLARNGRKAAIGPPDSVPSSVGSLRSIQGEPAGEPGQHIVESVFDMQVWASFAPLRES